MKIFECDDESIWTENELRVLLRNCFETWHYEGVDIDNINEVVEFLNNNFSRQFIEVIN